MAVGEFIEVNVQGLKELERALNELAEKVAKKVIMRTSREAMDMFKDRAEALAPVRTGKLFQNIVMKTKVKSDGVRGASVVVTVGLRVKPKEQSVFYGKFVEFGWVSRGGRHIPAKPWMRPAFDQTKNQMLNRFGAILGDEIEKEAKRSGLIM